ncbi:uncharacterized protein DEA37_0003261 [Paragonimus westermani]|uniref:Rotatin N-terminal domain-containing protein n=1 Tax=Paragonimus westermani TaxID=34504 RepID=A0A5J4NDL9_9TREM|nr:uncharacterized protein DEA37_0003261 [Paragonimus westermani]
MAHKSFAHGAKMAVETDDNCNLQTLIEKLEHQILTFPEVRLTKTDTDVLLASINSIKSEDMEVALAGVKFFQDVILEDFPAEIFIQRPRFIEVLFELLASRKHQLIFATVDVLICLVEKLINRVYFHLDPNNYSSFDGSSNSVSSEFSSTNPSANQLLSTEVPRVSIANPVAGPSTVLGHSSTCSVPEPHSDELRISLKACDQPGNFTLPDFGMELVRITGCLLRQLVETHLQSTSKSASGGTESTARTTNLQDLRYKGEAQLLRLVRLATRLILTSVSPVEQTKSDKRPNCQVDTVNRAFSWLLSCGPPNEDAIPPSELVNFPARLYPSTLLQPKNFVTFLEPWGSLLDSLASSWSQIAPLETGSCTDWSASDLTACIAAASVPTEYERHIYLAVLNTLFHFISFLFTPTTALSLLPTELRNAFSLALLETRLVHNVSNESADNSVHYHGLPAYVLLFNTGVYTTWQLLVRLERSMVSLVSFITELEDFDDDGDLKRISPSTLNLAVQGVDCLSIVGSNRFASEFVRFLNELSLHNLLLSPTTLWQSQLVLMRLLSHSLSTVRKTAYSSLVAIVRLSHSERQVEGCSSGANDVRQVTGVSAEADHTEVANTMGARQTSTPVDSATFEAALIQDLTDCLVGPPGSSSADIRSGTLPLLDHADNMCSDSRNMEEVDGLLRVMQLYADPHSDLGVRRAAGEQVLIMIKLLIKQSNSGAVHRDLADLIALCLFHSVIQTSTESPVCLPAGVCEGFLLPFTCPSYSLRSQWREVPDRDSGIVQPLLPFQPLLDLLSDSSVDSLTIRRLQTLVRRNFRYSWSVACHRSPHAFVHHCLTMVGAWPDTEAGGVDTNLIDRCFRHSRDCTPYPSQLSLSCTDISLFLLDYPEASLLLTVSSIQKATNHGAVARALSAFLRSIEAHYYSNSTHLLDSGLWDVNRCSSSCWWFFAHLDRFLSVLPACSADFNLLTALLDTVEHVGFRTVTPTLAKFGSSSKLCEWLISLFADTSGPLVHCLLQPHFGIGETDSQRLAASKRRLVHQQLPRLLYGLTQQVATLVVSCHCFQKFWSHPADHASSTSGSSRDGRSYVPSVTSFVELCLQWSYRAMKEFASAPFVDLVRLRLIVGVLCNLTCSTSWNSDLDRHWVVDLLLVSTQVLSQFDAGREEASESFMGLGSLQLLLSVINQLVHHIGTWTADLSSLVLSAPRTVGATSSVGLDCLSTWTGADWLLRCTVYRSVEVRAITLCILSRVCLVPDWARVFTSFQPSAETRTLLASRGRKLPPSGGRFWAMAISVLLDRREACLCAVQALHLLTNLTTLPIHPRDSGIFLPPEHIIDDHRSVGLTSLPPTQQTSLSESPAVTNSGTAFQQPPAAPPTEDEIEINADPSTTDPSVPLPAGDRPTLIGHMDSDSSSVVDIRDLFNSDLETSELRENLAELFTYLRPWFNDLFQPTYSVSAEPQEGRELDSRFDQPWLIHTSSIPRDTLLPCCFDTNSGIYLLGLPALQQLLIGQQMFSVFHQVLASYLPQPMLDPFRWNRLISVASAQSTTTSAEATNPAHADDVQTAEMITGVDIPFFTDQSTQRVTVADVHSATAPSAGLVSRFCTPPFVSSVCELFINLMHYLPKFVTSELSRLRINSLLMNIVDPNILDALLESNSTTAVDISVPQEVFPPHSPWFHTAAQLVSAFAMCLRVLRCQAAMHESFRVQLSSDARFLARLIRSLKHTDFADLLAPFWRELFALLTCLLMSPPSSTETSQTNDLCLRLIVLPLSSYVHALINIILHMLDRAETDVNKPLGELRPENAYVIGSTF